MVVCNWIVSQLILMASKAPPLTARDKALLECLKYLRNTVPNKTKFVNVKQKTVICFKGSQSCWTYYSRTQAKRCLIF